MGTNMDFPQLVQTIGLSGAILAVFGVAVWRSLNWLANNFFKPIADRHIKFVDSVESSFLRQTEMISRIESKLTSHGEDIEYLRTAVETGVICKNPILQHIGGKK